MPDQTPDTPSADAPTPESSGLEREWQAFWLAVGFLSRIPMLPRIDYSQRLMNQCSVYFPLVGLILGALYAGLYTLLTLGLNAPVAVLLVMIFHLWITGAFHEDGLADSLDALGGGYTVESRLRIMKDSRIGTYGTVALVMALALKFALLLDIGQVWLALMVAPVVARLTPLLLMRSMQYVSDPDTSKSKPVGEGFSTGRLVIAAGYVVMVTLVFSLWMPGLIFWSVVAVLGVAGFWGRSLLRAIGGFTGDALGASVVFSELVLLIGLAF